MGGGRARNINLQSSAKPGIIGVGGGDAMDLTRKHILASQNLNIHYAKQNHHVLGSGGYIEGRSVLTSDPEMLVRLYAGRGEPIIVNGKWNMRERFEHTEVIGIWKSSSTDETFSTTRGQIHYSKRGVHIVPARPANYEERVASAP